MTNGKPAPVWRSFWRNLRRGLHEHYPPCCVVRYSLTPFDRHFGKGVVIESDERMWVPCGWFHHETHSAAWLDAENARYQADARSGHPATERRTS